MATTNFQSWIGWYYTAFSILIPIVFSMHFPWDQFQETTKTVCNSKECKAISLDLIHCLKESVNPCDDFYEYVCGNWQRYIELEPYIGYLDLESLLQYEGYRKLKDKLAEPVKRNVEDASVVKAKTLYQECMKLPYLLRVDETVLREYMKDHGFWVAPPKNKKSLESWTIVHNHYLSISGDSSFFKITLSTSKDEEKPHLTLERPNSPYGAIYHTFQWEDEQRKQYFAFLETMITVISHSKPNTPPFESLQDDLRDIFNFRLMLQKIAISKEDPTISTPMKIKELTKWYNGKGCPPTGLNNVDWVQLFQALYANNPDVIITDDTVVHVHSKDYLNSLCTLLTRTRQRTIVNHIHLYFMERHIALKPNLKKSLIFSVTQGLTSNGKIRYIPHQWFTCIKTHNMPGVLGSLYTQYFFTKKMLQETTRIINNIKDIIVLQIENLKWMSDNSKQRTIQRVKQMKIVIGFPDKKDSTIGQELRSQMAESSIIAHAFHNIEANTIFISSLYYQQPVYDQNLPFPVTYASLGSLIAHEMYHMFDDDATSSGAMRQLWRKKSLKQYSRNAECIVEYYSKQPIKELEYKVYEKPKLKSRLTRDEDIADLMGLKAAYNAYKKMTWDGKGACPTLPRFENVSCDRLFFMAYARTFCSRLPEERLIRRLGQATHSPDRIRVNIPVSSMKEFARTFNCDIGTPMNPVDKCDLWA